MDKSLVGKPDFNNPIHDKDFCNQNQMQTKCETYMVLLQNFEGLMSMNNDNIDRIESLREALDTANHALKSYQYGNSSTDLAEEVSAKIEQALNPPE